jgi:murein DD-endopeptidase MepM/ murein hydrolase activator NlpD
LAVANGYVTRSSCSDQFANLGYGCYVEVWHAGGQRSVYAHLKPGSGVRRRTNVCLGWRVGRVGDNGLGASTCHLHFHMTKAGGPYKPEPMFGRRSGPSSCRNLTGLRAETYTSCTGWGCHNPQ